MVETGMGIHYGIHMDALVYSTMSTALVYNTVSLLLLIVKSGEIGDIHIFFQGPALMTRDTHVWLHRRQTCGPLVLYIWDHTTTRIRGGVVV